MPTPTYDLIEEQVLGSAATAITFSSIPGTYKDLVIEFLSNGSSVNLNLDFRVGNGSVDTGSNYSNTRLSGNGTSATSARASSQTSIRFGDVPYIQTGNNAFICALQFMSYANTNVNKTVLGRGNNANLGTEANVGLWRSTSAINIITFSNFSTQTYSTGTTVRLWGIAG